MAEHALMGKDAFCAHINVDYIGVGWKCRACEEDFMPMDELQGLIGKPRHSRIDKKKVAGFLRSQGYSIRQIMRILEYKSPRSVQDLLKPEEV